MTDDAREPRIDLDAFLAEAAESGGAERANAQTFLNGLADALAELGLVQHVGDAYTM